MNIDLQQAPPAQQPANAATDNVPTSYEGRSWADLSTQAATARPTGLAPEDMWGKIAKGTLLDYTSKLDVDTNKRIPCFKAKCKDDNGRTHVARISCNLVYSADASGKVVRLSPEQLQRLGATSKGMQMTILGFKSNTLSVGFWVVFIPPAG